MASNAKIKAKQQSNAQKGANRSIKLIRDIRGAVNVDKTPWAFQVTDSPKSKP